MADFFLTTSTNVAQTMAFADSGVVAQGVTLFVANSTSAVTMNGAARLTALGSVVTENAATLTIASTAISATVNVGQSGSMISMLNAAIAGTITDQFFLNNSGVIQGFAEAIRITAASSPTLVADIHIVNSGTIQSNADVAGENVLEFITPSDGTVNIVNSGSILNVGNASGVALLGGRLNLSNSGVIDVGASRTAIATDFQPDTVVNTGRITGIIALSEGSDILRNSGTIQGSVLLDAGSDFLENFGLITGTVDMNDFGSLSNNVDTLFNSGTIAGDIRLGEGDDTFTNLGGTVLGNVDGGSGNDRYIIDRYIHIQDESGADTVVSSVSYVMATGIESLALDANAGLTGQGNSLGNLISGSDFGQNRLLGKRGDDQLFSNGQGDSLDGGAGNDSLFVSDGLTTVAGGAGTDTLRFIGVAGVLVNLQTGLGQVEQLGSLTLSGIENVSGTSSADSLSGNAGVNVLDGGGGDDDLRAGGGNDSLRGGSGKDLLTGGTGNDSFLFLFDTESVVGDEDVIVDFNPLQDLIDLSRIDADPGNSASSFAFIGTDAFSGSKAKVRYFTDSGANRTVVEIRTEGAVTNVMVIFLTGIHTLAADDFLL